MRVSLAFIVLSVVMSARGVLAQETGGSFGGGSFGSSSSHSESHSSSSRSTFGSSGYASPRSSSSSHSSYVGSGRPVEWTTGNIAMTVFGVVFFLFPIWHYLVKGVPLFETHFPRMPVPLSVGLVGPYYFALMLFSGWLFNLSGFASANWGALGVLGLMCVLHLLAFVALRLMLRHVPPS